MKTNEIASTQDIINLEKSINDLRRLIESKLLNQPNNSSSEYLRSKEVRELLKISDNTLRSMRENGDIPYSFLGKIYYYPKKDILKLLKENIINKQQSI